MRETKGITLIALAITIIIMAIIATITVYYGTDLIRNVKLQDLKTTMLLIEAKTKECVEEANFQKLDLAGAASNNILLGTPLSTNSEVQTAANATGKIEGDINQYYYLSEQTLIDIGLKDVGLDYGYFIVKYDITNIKVEVINTSGYDGKYTLEEIKALEEE